MFSWCRSSVYYCSKNKRCRYQMNLFILNISALNYMVNKDLELPRVWIWFFWALHEIMVWWFSVFCVQEMEKSVFQHIDLFSRQITRALILIIFDTVGEYTVLPNFMRPLAHCFCGILLIEKKLRAGVFLHADRCDEKLLLNLQLAGKWMRRETRRQKRRFLLLRQQRAFTRDICRVVTGVVLSRDSCEAPRVCYHISQLSLRRPLSILSLIWMIWSLRVYVMSVRTLAGAV